MASNLCVMSSVSCQRSFSKRSTLFLSETDPCNPSPCNANGECQVRNGAAVCNYPECVINQDCPRDRACYSQKCRDPCVGACGINSLCQTVNHAAVCSCPSDYTGNPQIECRIPVIVEGIFLSSYE